jgi:hypothetical protein
VGNGKMTEFQHIMHKLRKVDSFSVVPESVVHCLLHSTQYSLCHYQMATSSISLYIPLFSHQMHFGFISYSQELFFSQSTYMK